MTLIVVIRPDMPRILILFTLMDVMTSIHSRTFVLLSPEAICETSIRTSGKLPDMEDHVSLDANHWRPLVL